MACVIWEVKWSSFTIHGEKLSWVTVKSNRQCSELTDTEKQKAGTCGTGVIGVLLMCDFLNIRWLK
ncbi:hypothetical protein JV35_13385 [Pectobacterium betavasculorum]|uniref:Uncharacterized protein n=1 Tax=Pectobacterium betavasculorum TaxID=55207 RepID=A0ABR4UXC4_9GAMM|nr:hypothetical protein JV35_13385 [Pectobacterium betavasculorum]